MKEDNIYWEISGPRKYLNIPTVVPDYWRAELSFWFPDQRPNAVGWGPTMDAAMDAARNAASQISGLKRE